MTLTTSASTTDWISALAAVGAAAGTVFALVVAVRTLRLQVHVGLRHQAARIVVDAERHQESAELVVRNMSDLPITELKGVAYQSAYRFIIFVKMKVDDLDLGRDYLAPGTETRIPFSLLADYTNIGANVMFRDSSGFTWTRQWPSGQLSLLSRGTQRAGHYFGLSVFLIVTTFALTVFTLSRAIDYGPGHSYINFYYLFVSLFVFIGSLALAANILQWTIRTYRKPIKEFKLNSDKIVKNKKDVE